MIFKILIHTPLIGESLRIMNAYAYHGEATDDDSYAGHWRWIKAFGLEFFIGAVLTALCSPDKINLLLEHFGLSWRLAYEVTENPADLATSILPNILGFGMGVYALIFGLKGNFLREIQKTYEGKTGSVLVLNADMAVPLLAIFFAIVTGLASKIFPCSAPLSALSWTTLWLSFIFTLELVYSLFALGETSILKSISEKE